MRFDFNAGVQIQKKEKEEWVCVCVWGLPSLHSTALHIILIIKTYYLRTELKSVVTGWLTII